MAELNELLLAGAAKDDRRFIAGRRIAVGDHFALEAEALRPLPTDAFDYRALGNFRVDRKSRSLCQRGAVFGPLPTTAAGAWTPLSALKSLRSWTARSSWPGTPGAKGARRTLSSTTTWRSWP